MSPSSTKEALSPAVNGDSLPASLFEPLPRGSCPSSTWTQPLLDPEAIALPLHPPKVPFTETLPCPQAPYVSLSPPPTPTPFQVQGLGGIMDSSEQAVEPEAPQEAKKGG